MGFTPRNKNGSPQRTVAEAGRIGGPRRRCVPTETSLRLGVPALRHRPPIFWADSNLGHLSSS